MRLALALLLVAALTAASLYAGRIAIHAYQAAQQAHAAALNKGSA